MKPRKTRKQIKVTNPSRTEERVVLSMELQLQYDTPEGRAELLEYLQQQTTISMRGVSGAGRYNCASIAGSMKVRAQTPKPVVLPLEKYRLQEGLKWKSSTEGSKEMMKDTHD